MMEYHDFIGTLKLSDNCIDICGQAEIDGEIFPLVVRVERKNFIRPPTAWSNHFESGELQEEAVVSKMETTAADGKPFYFKKISKQI